MTSPNPTQKGSDPAVGSRPGLILAFLCVGQFMVFLDLSIVNLALPSIQDSLGMSDVSLNYIVTAYATVLGGFLLLGGRLADTFGRRRVLQIGYLIFAAASLVSGFATNGTMLIIARSSQGLGAALMAPAALSILTNTFAEGAPATRRSASGARSPAWRPSSASSWAACSPTAPGGSGSSGSTCRSASARRRSPAASSPRARRTSGAAASTSPGPRRSPPACCS